MKILSVFLSFIFINSILAQFTCIECVPKNLNNDCSSIFSWNLSKSIQQNIQQNNLGVYAYGIKNYFSPSGNDWNIIEKRIMNTADGVNVLVLSGDKDPFNLGLFPRTEIVFRPSLVFNPNTDYTIDYPIMFKNINQRAVVLQIITRPIGQSSGGYPLFQIMLWRNNIVVRGYAITNFVDLAPITIDSSVANKIYNFKVEFKISTDNSGYYIVKDSNKVLYRFNGKTHNSQNAVSLQIGAYSDDADAVFIKGLTINKCSSSQPSPPTPAPKPSQPTPAPKPSQPTPAPKPSQPTPAPKPSQPTPAPKPSQPTPAPKPSQPTPLQTNYRNQKDIVISNRQILNMNIRFQNCENILIENCYLETSSLNFVTSKKITVKNCDFINSDGAATDHAIIFNQCQDGNVLNSYFQEPIGTSELSDIVNSYKSERTLIQGNYVIGGGPNKAGGGLLMDNYGKWQQIDNNICVDCGQYGMGIAGGENNVLSNNQAYSRQHPWSNVAFYTYGWPKRDLKVINATIINNRAGWINSKGKNNGWWLGPNVYGKVEVSGNNFNVPYQVPPVPNNVGSSFRKKQ
jgi:hypothetical protein